LQYFMYREYQHVSSSIKVYWTEVEFNLHKAYLEIPWHEHGGKNKISH